MLRTRLEDELEANGGFSCHQHGFRKSKSTLHALEKVVKATSGAKSNWCMLITLDVKNAFNTIRHGHRLNELRQRGVSGYMTNILADYLEDREIILPKKNVWHLDLGVPQGSTLGPTLWNVGYDGVLRMELGSGVMLEGFADDLGMVVVGKSAEETVRRADVAIRKVSDWLTEKGFMLAPQKTEAVLLRGAKRKGDVKLTIDNVNIYPKKSVLYLGVVFDQYGTFGRHIERVIEKAKRQVTILNKLLRNTGGPNSHKKKLLKGVVQNTLLYAAPIWASQISRIKKYKNLIISIQRKALLRVASAYCTVSSEALQIPARSVPIDMLANERASIWRRQKEEDRQTVKVEERTNTIKEWQKRWNECKTAKWTRKLIPSLSKWLECKWWRLNYWLTQALTGHGCFKTYTHKIGKAESIICDYCEKEDNPEHTLFECSRWIKDRTTTEITTGPLSPTNLVDCMISKKENWTAIEKFISQVMRQK